MPAADDTSVIAAAPRDAFGPTTPLAPIGVPTPMNADAKPGAQVPQGPATAPDPTIGAPVAVKPPKAKETKPKPKPEAVKTPEPELSEDLAAALAKADELDAEATAAKAEPVKPPAPPPEPAPQTEALEVAKPPAVNPPPVMNDAVVNEAAPPEGLELPEFTGDPDSPVLPGTEVFYWMRSHRAGWMEAHAALVLDRLAGGSYNGVRFRPRQDGCLPMHGARPSPVPRLGYFTPRRQFPSESMRLKPGE